MSPWSTTKGGDVPTRREARKSRGSANLRRDRPRAPGARVGPREKEKGLRPLPSETLGEGKVTGGPGKGGGVEGVD